MTTTWDRADETHLFRSYGRRDLCRGGGGDTRARCGDLALDRRGLLCRGVVPRTERWLGNVGLRRTSWRRRSGVRRLRTRGASTARLGLPCGTFGRGRRAVGIRRGGRAHASSAAGSDAQGSQAPGRREGGGGRQRPRDGPSRADPAPAGEWLEASTPGVVPGEFLHAGAYRPGQRRRGGRARAGPGRSCEVARSERADPRARRLRPRDESAEEPLLERGAQSGTIAVLIAETPSGVVARTSRIFRGCSGTADELLPAVTSWAERSR